METVATIAVAELREILEAGRPVTVLDVRPAAEREEWSIPGSLHVDAYEALWADDPGALADLDLPRGRPVVTVCMAGKTSILAAQRLSARGYETLSLQGGMRAWSLAWNTAEVALRHAGVQVVQVRRTGKGCLSYIIGSHGEALVIDASLPPEVYIEIAEKHGWRIAHAIDTHVHADHLSRSRQLAEITGATLWLPENNRVSFPYRPLRDGDLVESGEARLTVLSTPGHTPESASYLLDGEVLFTGDTLSLRGVGRPDLEATPDEAAARAHLLWRSLRRLVSLPPNTIVLPGHSSEPIPFDQVPLYAPLGHVRQRVHLLDASEPQFVKEILSRIPPAPHATHRIVTVNETGRWDDINPVDLEAGANRCAIS
jgi:glyoxylase-like metal-dependent hydrolase (beta-lactamase superfamily II)/rhodanese-related sulfurtransferase